MPPREPPAPSKSSTSLRVAHLRAEDAYSYARDIDQLRREEKSARLFIYGVADTKRADMALSQRLAVEALRDAYTPYDSRQVSRVAPLLCGDFTTPGEST